MAQGSYRDQPPPGGRECIGSAVPGGAALPSGWSGWRTATAPAVFVATNLADSGDGSLRQAIVQSNSTRGPNEIDFAPGLSGTIVLRSSADQLADHQRREGSSVRGRMCSASAATTDASPGRSKSIWFMSAMISGLTITGGRVSDVGVASSTTAAR